MGWNEELPDNILMSLHMTEKDTGLFMPATYKLQDRFLEERIKLLDFARALLYSMKSDCSFVDL